MLWAQRLWLRLQTLFRRERAVRLLDDELQFHLDEQIAENVAAGMSREEARHAAMRAFGNSTVLKEETRETWGWIWLGTNRPGFTLRIPRASQEPSLHRRSCVDAGVRHRCEHGDVQPAGSGCSAAFASPSS